MLRQAINNIPDESWHNNIRKWYFSLTAYHIVETMDFYSRGTHEGMQWGKRAGFEWSQDNDIEQETLSKITKELVTSCLDEIADKLTNYLLSVSDTELRTKDGFSWFDNILEKLIYLIRHSMHHIGELDRMLQECDYERIEWT